jgi:hypothetical protein
MGRTRGNGLERFCFILANNDLQKNGAEWYATSIQIVMSDHITSLLKLQAFDFKEDGGQISEAQREEIRKSIPQPILAHYDRLVARGKKGVSIVRNQVCTGCHMRLPIGTINTLMQHQDIQLCDSCGRYLALAETPESTAAPAPVEVKAETKPAAKRKRKAAAQPAAV